MAKKRAPQRPRTKALTDVDSLVAGNIRRERLARGISQEIMAKHLGVSFQQVQKYEKGVNRLSIGRLSRVADILGVGLGVLLPGEQANGAAQTERDDACFLLSQTRMGHRAAAAFIALPTDLLRHKYLELMETTANSIPSD